MDDFYDDVCASMVDEVSVAISVAISGILQSASNEHNEESSQESGGSMESVEHEEEQIKTNVIAEDADTFFFITEIDGTQGIHHDSDGNTEILLLEPSKDPFQLSYFSGNTEVSSSKVPWQW
jgi:sucrose-6-phosphate hydrolase SacC (GH32 family)